MKKIAFTLIALSMFSVASASNGKVEKPVKEPKQPEKKEVSKENAKEEVREVHCTAWINGQFYETYYTCFFCWGGADRGCKAQLLANIQD